MASALLADADAGAVTCREDVDYELPYLIAEGPHWFALYKPPFWEISVDSVEAARVASSTPFAGDEDTSIEEDVKRNCLKMQEWVRPKLAPHYPICNDETEAFGFMHRLDAQTS